MEVGNKISMIECHFLDASYFTKLYEAFIEAFSDYVIPFALTETQFQNHIVLNGVDLERTIGVVDAGRVIGFTLNGFGKWLGKSTVYDAGTGVIPSFRRRGISKNMFKEMMPRFKSQGIEQCLLEVATENTAAVSLYKKLGFITIRELALMQSDKAVEGHDDPSNVVLRDIENADWERLSTFWDGEPSWQNSVSALERTNKLKRFLGAYIDDKCVGYMVFSPKFGRVAQIAVDREYRRRGIGTALIRRMHREMAQGYSMQVINIDKSLDSVIGFLRNRGFYERLSQYEMICKL